MPHFPVEDLPAQVAELQLADAQVYHLPNWDRMSHPERLAVIRQLATARGRDPRMAKLTTSIFRKYRAWPRDHKAQAAALLKWVQDPKNVYYVNEPGERLQDPFYSLKVGFGDCDDMISLLCAFFESQRFPWKLCLAGKDALGNKVRYIEGDPVPAGVVWSHIYCMVGAPPFTPKVWWFCEPTVIGVPLGWDVMEGDKRYLPKSDLYRGAPRVEIPGRPPLLYQPSAVPPAERRSPAYDFLGYGDLGAAGSDVGMSAGASTAASMQNRRLDAFRIFEAVVTGVCVATATTLLVDWIRGAGIWEKKGNVIDRWRGVVVATEDAG